MHVDNKRQTKSNITKAFETGCLRLQHARPCFETMRLDCVCLIIIIIFIIIYIFAISKTFTYVVLVDNNFNLLGVGN
jgi:hypothetical protein